MTREIAWSAATDAGNRSMRAAGRKAWSDLDFAEAIRKFDELWPESEGGDA